MIIGIAGNINSGKDTVASMLLYIHQVGKNNAKYADWLTKKLAYDNSFKHKTIHFADIAKNNLSSILGISVDVFNNRLYKDELWYIPSTGKFIEEKDIARHKVINLENINELDITNKKHIVKLRTILQAYAESCKKIFGNNTWVANTMRIASDINMMYKICIIPDIRFKNESEWIKSYNGIVIYITRPNNEIQSNHVSENNDDIFYNFHINNISNQQTLFFKVLAIYDQIKHML